MTNHVRSLRSIAFARSGDKGGDANVGVWTRSHTAYRLLCELLTTEAVRAHFAGLGCGEVLRYELPNLHALNFVLVDFLDGGGTTNLRVDAQGKALGLAMLEMMIQVPEGFVL